MFFSVKKSITFLYFIHYLPHTSVHGQKHPAADNTVYHLQKASPISLKREKLVTMDLEPFPSGQWAAPPRGLQSAAPTPPARTSLVATPWIDQNGSRWSRAGKGTTRWSRAGKLLVKFAGSGSLYKCFCRKNEKCSSLFKIHVAQNARQKIDAEESCLPVFIVIILIACCLYE